MAEELNIVYVESPGETEWGAIGGGIKAYNQQHAGAEGAQRVCFVLHNPEKQVVGGVIGLVYWDWFYLDLIWIQESFRGLGYGSKLLALAEEEARKRGANHVHLDTFSFQAPDFYKKHGYRVFGELKNFPTGHQRFYLTKDF